MKYRFFQVPPHGGEVEDELNRFLAGHRVLSVDRQFIADGQQSAWAVCVGFLEGTPASPVRKAKVDYREVLGEADFGVFAKLRSLRKRLSDAEGVPPYALFSNEQLAQMVTQRVATRSGLEAIDGVGEARVRKYAGPFLELLAAEWAVTRPEAAETPAEVGE